MSNNLITPNSRKNPNKIRNELMQERERIKEEIMREGQSFKVQAACMRVYGPEAGVMIHHLLYLEGLGVDPFGWIYKSEPEWTEEKGLSRHAQRKGRKRAIGAGVWEEEKRGVPARNWYRLDLHKLAEDIAPYLNSEGDATRNECDNSEATIVASQVGRIKSPDKSGELREPTITKEDPKETTVESNGDGSNFENEFEEHEETHDTAGKVVAFPRVKERPEPPTHITPKWLDEPVELEKVLARYDEWFEEYGIRALTKHERRRYGLEIATIVNDYRVDADELNNVVNRVINRQAADENPYRLSPLWAYNDEVEGKPMPEMPARVQKARAKARREEWERERAAAYAEDEENPY